MPVTHLVLIKMLDSIETYTVKGIYWIRSTEHSGHFLNTILKFFLAQAIVEWIEKIKIVNSFVILCLILSRLLLLLLSFDVDYIEKKTNNSEHQ